MAVLILINAPYRLVREKIRLFRELDVGVEVYFDNHTIEDIREGHVDETARILRGEGIACSVHAPFMDLSPGGVDRDVRRITKDKLKKAVTMANRLDARSIVCHPGYDRWRFGEAPEIWLEGSVDTWTEVLAAAGEKLPVMLENIFEEEPDTFLELFRYFRNKNINCCFDSGHFNLFTKVPLDKWLSTIGNNIKEMHLHDNFGKRDDHLPIGQGTFPFRELREFVRPRVDDIIITAELRDESHAAVGIKNLKEYVA